MTTKTKATIETICNGEAIGEINEAIHDAITHCLDWETEANKKRTVTVKISVKPDETRTAAVLECEVKTKLPPKTAREDTVLIDGINGGGYVENEQMRLMVPVEGQEAMNGQFMKD